MRGYSIGASQRRSRMYDAGLFGGLRPLAPRRGQPRHGPFRRQPMPEHLSRSCPVSVTCITRGPRAALAKPYPVKDFTSYPFLQLPRALRVGSTPTGLATANARQMRPDSCRSWGGYSCGLGSPITDREGTMSERGYPCGGVRSRDEPRLPPGASLSVSGKRCCTAKSAILGSMRDYDSRR